MLSKIVKPVTFKLKYLLIIAGILMLLYLQYLLWFGHGGHYEHKKLLEVIAKKEQENAKLSERNKVLSAEVDDLKNGNIAVEEHARLDLGLIKPGETFIQMNITE